MQSIAMENNLSETSFFIIKDNKYYIRWFTPVTEIGLAGHPTLATAHIIFQDMSYKKNKIEFHTKTGDILTVIKKENILNMDFPSYNSICLDEKLDEISKALRAKPKKYFLSKYGMAIYEKEQDIIDISPDFERLNKIDNIGIIATAPGNNYDFVSRFFAPKLGIQEDPVTGSAHCQLIPYWSKVLNKKNMLCKPAITKRRRASLYVFRKKSTYWWLCSNLYDWRINDIKFLRHAKSKYQKYVH